MGKGSVAGLTDAEFAKLSEREKDCAVLMASIQRHLQRLKNDLDALEWLHCWLRVHNCKRVARA